MPHVEEIRNIVISCKTVPFLMYKHVYSFLTKHTNMRCILQKEIQMYYYLKLVMGSEESKL
jgi:hypothetical protein